MNRFSPDDIKQICEELIAKAWASTRWKKGGRPERHVCHRAACLIGQLEDEITQLKAMQSERTGA